jgi:hypothetical protein
MTVPQPTPMLSQWQSAQGLWESISSIWADPLLPTPHHPFLVADDKTPAVGQMTETAFLARVADIVIRAKPAGGDLAFEQRAALAVKLLKPVLAGLGTLCPLEPLLRRLMGLDLHAAYNTEEQADALAAVLALHVALLDDLDEPDADSYTADDLKDEAVRAAMSAAAAFGRPFTAAEKAKRNSIRIKGSGPSSPKLGGRVHSLIQLEYRLYHPKNAVITDARWFSIFGQVLYSKAMHELTDESDPPLRYYYRKILAYKTAMKKYQLFLGAALPVRPDICDMNKNDAYEIKPRAQARAGYDQLKGYLHWYNKEARADRLKKPGPGGVPDMRGGAWIPPADWL